MYISLEMYFVLAQEVCASTRRSPAGEWSLDYLCAAVSTYYFLPVPVRSEDCLFVSRGSSVCSNIATGLTAAAAAE